MHTRQSLISRTENRSCCLAMMLNDNCKINYGALVLGTAPVPGNYLKISHEITNISVLAGSLWDSTIVPVYLFWDYQVHASRPS